jgi:AcrR family transcriptional regulator
VPGEGVTVTARASVFAPEIAELPRGYTGLPRELVAASQRQRLVHGVIAAVAEKGFAAATVSQIAEHGGVSNKTFYEHFDDKLGCFVAAYDVGSEAILTAVATASAAARADGAGAIDQLRSGTRAYLDFLAREEPYARTFCLEMLAAGPVAVARHRACRDAFAEALATWHAVNRAEHPAWPSPSPLAFEAATGAVYEVSSARIAVGRGAELPPLEAELLAAQLAVLGISEPPER